MPGLQRLRKRLPLIVFLLLVILVVMLVGFACACLTDHPMQVAERALAAIGTAPGVPVAGLHALALALLLTAVALRPVARPPTPATLQRFLF